MLNLINFLTMFGCQLAALLLQPGYFLMTMPSLLAIYLKLILQG